MRIYWTVTTLRIALILYVCWYFRPAVIGLTDRVVWLLGVVIDDSEEWLDQVGRD